MDEIRAQRVVAALRMRGVNAHLYQENGLFGVRVSPADEHGPDLDGSDAEITGMSIPKQIQLRARSLAGVPG